jgi:hypothetical protein
MRSLGGNTEREAMQMTSKKTSIPDAPSQVFAGSVGMVSDLVCREGVGYTFATQPGLPSRPAGSQTTQPQDTSVPETIDPSWATS